MIHIIKDNNYIIRLTSSLQLLQLSLLPNMAHFIYNPVAGGQNGDRVFNADLAEDKHSGAHHDADGNDVIAREFYLRNRAFLRGSVTTVRDLQFVFALWIKTPAGQLIVERLAQNHFTRDVVLTAHNIVNELVSRQILHLIHSGKDWSSHYVRKIVWHPVGREPTLPAVGERVKEVPGEPDRDDGTEEFSRRQAHAFYMETAGFLVRTIRTRKALAFIYRMWRDGANPMGITSLGDKWVGWRPFRQVLFALAKDGRVCRVTVSRNNVPLIRWCWSNPADIPTAGKGVSVSTKEASTSTTEVSPQTLPPPEKTRDKTEAMRRRLDEKASLVQAYDPQDASVCMLDKLAPRHNSVEYKMTQEDMDVAVATALAMESAPKESAKTEE